MRPKDEAPVILPMRRPAAGVGRDFVELVIPPCQSSRVLRIAFPAATPGHYRLPFAPNHGLTVDVRATDGEGRASV